MATPFPGRKLPPQHCTWCGHTRHVEACAVVMEKQPCPCQHRDGGEP